MPSSRRSFGSRFKGLIAGKRDDDARSSASSSRRHSLMRSFRESADTTKSAPIHFPSASDGPSEPNMPGTWSPQVKSPPVETTPSLPASTITTPSERSGSPTPSALSTEDVIHGSRSNSKQTTVHSHLHPAVTHETVRPHTHHVTHKHIYREIHSHDVMHRVQPVIDVDVLPARHFVKDGEELREVDVRDIPGRVDHAEVHEAFKQAARVGSGEHVGGVSSDTGAAKESAETENRNAD